MGGGPAGPGGSLFRGASGTQLQDQDLVFCYLSLPFPQSCVPGSVPATLCQLHALAPAAPLGSELASPGSLVSYSLLSYKQSVT